MRKSGRGENPAPDFSHQRLIVIQGSIQFNLILEAFAKKGDRKWMPRRAKNCKKSFVSLWFRHLGLPKRGPFLDPTFGKPEFPNPGLSKFYRPEAYRQEGMWWWSSEGVPPPTPLLYCVSGNPGNGPQNRRVGNPNLVGGGGPPGRPGLNWALKVVVLVGGGPPPYPTCTH